jgi:hypothetical protein
MEEERASSPGRCYSVPGFPHQINQSGSSARLPGTPSAEDLTRIPMGHVVSEKGVRKSPAEKSEPMRCPRRDRIRMQQRRAPLARSCTRDEEAPPRLQAAQKRDIPSLQITALLGC